MTPESELQSKLIFVKYSMQESKSEMYSSQQVVVEQLFELAQQSDYGPSRQSLSEFISDFLNRSGAEEKEEKLLFVVLDEQPTAQAFLQARFFGETADLDFVVVDRLQRGKGLGKGLLELMERELRSAGVLRVMLEVATGNQDALQLYLKSGYKKISVRKSYYRTGEDALVMEKIL
ncbi:GNAT family N-acetyltransferase [bacterium]|nr:GNAT family N-acetyltransferase [bacterium]